MLEAADQQLARFKEKTELGVFRDATPYPLLLSQIPQAPLREIALGPSEAHPPTSPRPPLVVLDSI